MHKNMTTEAVAKMLNVNKSTVKRWSDSGKIRCVRTVGQHRKFSYDDVIEFAALQNIQTGQRVNDDLSYCESVVVRDMVRRNDLNAFRSVMFGSALRGNRPEIIILLFMLKEGRLSQKDILTAVLFPVLKKLERMVEIQKIEASQGRIAKNSISNAFASYCDRLERQRTHTSAIVIFTFELTLEHELRILESKLEPEGYLVVNLGLVPSWPSVEQWIARNSSNILLCIMKHSQNRSVMPGDFNALERIAEDREIVFLCGTVESFVEMDLEYFKDNYCRITVNGEQ